MASHIIKQFKKLEDGFELNLQWNRQKPQIIDGAIILNLEIVKIFCERELQNDTTARLIVEKCKTFTNYHLDLTKHHEKWMSK